MEQLLSVFKALSDRNRLRVFAALTAHEELCACQITELLGITGATASRHMGLLLSARLVQSRKEGRWVHYRLNHDSPSFAPVMEWVQGQFRDDIDIRQDKTTLKEITSCQPEELCRKQRQAECCPK